MTEFQSMLIIAAICAFGVFLRSSCCETVERVVTRSGLTDGLYWDLTTMRLFFEDTYGNSLCSYNPSTLQQYCANLGKNYLPSFAVPLEKPPRQFVVGASNDIVLITWDGNTNVTNVPIKVLASVDKNIQDNRINYGTVDPLGKLWFGTANKLFAVNKSSVYSLDSNLNLQTQISPVSFSSGLVWSAEKDKLYFVDSLSFQVASYDYDMKQGTVMNRKVIFDLPENGIIGNPGRLDIDSVGHLWVPIYNGSLVIEIDPHSQKLLRTINIPSKRVGAVTFGGPDLDIMYVSTIGYGFNNPAEKTPADDQFGGSIYAVKDLGVKGLEIKIKFQITAKL